MNKSFIKSLVCLILLFRSLEGLRTKDKEKYIRNKRQLATGVLSVMSTATSNIKNAYQNSELQTTGDVALILVKSLPILGDIITILTEEPGSASNQEYESEQLLATIKDNLEILGQNIQRTGTRVEALAKQIDLSVIENQVAEDKREIYNCHEDLLLFLRNPSSNAERDRLKICYLKFGYIRQVGSILTDKEQTFMQKPLFEQIIYIDGYCNGSNINAVYKYLLGLYIEGCTALIMSEVLKYNNSFTYQVECTATIETAKRNFEAFYDKCAKESCSNYVSIMEKALKMPNTTDIMKKLKKTFPWFHCTVVLLNDDGGDLKVYGDQINIIQLKKNDKITRVLMWSQMKNVLNTTIDNFGIIYENNSVLSIYNGLNLQKTISNGSTSLFGYFSGDSLRNDVCQKEIQLHTESGTENENDKNTTLLYVGICCSIFGVLVLFLVCYCICRKGLCFVCESDDY